MNDEDRFDSEQAQPDGAATEKGRHLPSMPPSSAPWALTLVLILLVLVVVFAVQNTQTVDINFLGWTWRSPMAIALVAAVVVAIVLDQVLAIIVRRRRARRLAEQEELRSYRESS